MHSVQIEYMPRGDICNFLRLLHYCSSWTLFSNVWKIWSSHWCKSAIFVQKVDCYIYASNSKLLALKSSKNRVTKVTFVGWLGWLTFNRLLDRKMNFASVWLLQPNISIFLLLHSFLKNISFGFKSLELTQILRAE